MSIALAPWGLIVYDWSVFKWVLLDDVVLWLEERQIKYTIDIKPLTRFIDIDFESDDDQAIFKLTWL